MGYFLKSSSTAKPLLFLLIQSSDHITGLTGATPTVTISKSGGSFAAPAGAVSEIGSGWYKIAGNATDTNTLGPLVLHATATSADPVDDTFNVVAFDPDDASAFGLSRIDATISSRSTYAGGDTPGTTTLLGRVDVTVSSRLAATSYTAPDNTSITAIKAVTDHMATMIVLAGSTYRFTADSLSNVTADVDLSGIPGAVWTYSGERNISNPYTIEQVVQYDEIVQQSNP